MPRIQGSISPAKPAEFRRRRFSVSPTIDGYEVVDDDGRAVSNHFEFANLALELAGDLNSAAARGKRSLAVALGATEGAFEAV